MINVERLNENERVVTSESYNKLFIRRTPGTDLWTVHNENGGTVATPFRGSYTSPTLAIEAITNYITYLNSKKK